MVDFSHFSVVVDKFGASVGLTLKFHEHPKFVHFGHKIRAECMAKAGIDGQLSWMLKNTTDVFPIRDQDSRFTVTNTHRKNNLYHRQCAVLNFLPIPTLTVRVIYKTDKYCAVLNIFPLPTLTLRMIFNTYVIAHFCPFVCLVS